MDAMNAISNEMLIELFLVGCFGSCAIEIVTVLKHIVSNNIPIFYYSPLYWTCRIGLVLIAGGLVYIYIRSGIVINHIIAFNIGAFAPLLIEKFSQEPHFPYTSNTNKK